MEEGDPAALALLDVAAAMGDMVDEGGDDNSLEVFWLLDYAKEGFSGPVVWKRKDARSRPRRKA